jgi:hypothetical protein
MDPFTFLIIYRRLDESTAAASHRISDGGKSLLREQIGNRRMRFTDNQRCWPAVKAERLNRKVPAQVAAIVTPETLMAWHRKFDCEQKYGDGGRLAYGSLRFGENCRHGDRVEPMACQTGVSV